MVYETQGDSKSQQQLANIAMREFEEAVSQPTVSRSIQKVKNWIRAGNVLPDMEGDKPKQVSVDPSTINMGKRTDTRIDREKDKHSQK